MDTTSVFITQSKAAASLFLLRKLSWTLYRQTDSGYVLFFFNCFCNVYCIIFNLNCIEWHRRPKKLIEWNFTVFWNAIYPHFRKQKFTLGSRLNVLFFWLTWWNQPRYHDISFFTLWGPIKKRRNTLQVKVKTMFSLELCLLKWLGKNVNIFDLAHKQRKTKILKIKNLSREVHRTSKFPLNYRSYLFFALGKAQRPWLIKHCSAK